MSEIVEPKVFLLGETKVDHRSLRQLMEHFGVPEWHSDAGNDMELITEVMGRSCYKSFGTTLNPNITKVRETSGEYFENTLAKGDGSIFEHAVSNWFFADVSRVFTHELVRHRAGVAISQESLRFVRLTDLKYHVPEGLTEAQKEIFSQAVSMMEQVQKDLVDSSDIEESGFSRKKELSSAFRRMAPMGLATNIGWSCNIRALRWIIEQRTSLGAEEEIRTVFSQVAKIAIARWPGLFQDFDEINWPGQANQFKPINRKV